MLFRVQPTLGHQKFVLIEQLQEYRIFWSSTVADAFPEHLDKLKKYQNHRIYSCTTSDFNTYSPTELFFDPGFNCIDASIGYHDGQYLMVFKDERGDNSYFPDDLDHKCLLIARSESIQGSWEIDSEPISPTTISVDQSNDKNLWAEVHPFFGIIPLPNGGSFLNIFDQ